MDIADQSSNAILRPGKAPRWLIVGSEVCPPVAIVHYAKSPKTFGQIECVESMAGDCCGAIFVSEIDGGLYPRNFWRLEYFFARDKAEALVFEFDRWQGKFFARRLEELWNRRK